MELLFRLILGSIICLTAYALIWLLSKLDKRKFKSNQ